MIPSLTLAVFVPSVIEYISQHEDAGLVSGLGNPCTELNSSLCYLELFLYIVVLSVSMIFPASLAALWAACLVCVCAVGSDS